MAIQRRIAIEKHIQIIEILIIIVTIKNARLRYKNVKMRFIKNILNNDIMHYVKNSGDHPQLDECIRWYMTNQVSSFKIRFPKN